MRVCDSSCESKDECIDGSPDSSAGIFVDDLPSNAGKNIGVGSGVPRPKRLLQILLMMTRNKEMNSCLASIFTEAKPAIQRMNLKCRCKDGNIYFAS